MSDEKLMGLSALTDGECSDLEANTALSAAKDEDLRAAWTRYHLIGSVMRNELPRFMDKGFANRLQQAIASEPTVLAPRERPAQSWLRPVAGLAIAASVAAVAVLRVGNFDAALASKSANPGAGVPMAAASVDTNGTTRAGMTIDAVPVMAAQQPSFDNDAFSATPASYSAASAWMQPETDGTQGVIVVAPARSRVNSYLMHYSQQRTMMGSPGVLPYAKVVGYTPEQ
ncbi:MAG: sigma-E factor negative regulatory protein [Gammaproteobacteria bacterium]